MVDILISIGRPIPRASGAILVLIHRFVNSTTLGCRAIQTYIPLVFRAENANQALFRQNLDLISLRLGWPSLYQK
jgi:hypothetical protein